ncbi:MAG: extracellular solute-binding protein [Spirochaetaceae bacterium]|nr:extracellular solute-binding protein [Spirochaetaceae bacterium]
MKSKYFVLMAIFLCSGILLMANGEGEASGQTNSIEFWAYQPERNEIELMSAIENFEVLSGFDVNVTFIPKSDYNTKLNASIAAEMMPDVAYLDQPLVPRYAKDGILLNLEEFANGENGIDRTLYYPGAMATNEVDGELYGLPLNQTCVALIYNKDLVPQAPDTWKDWLNIARDVYVPGEIAAFETPNGDGWGAWLFPAFVASAGGSLVNEDETVVTIGEQPAIDALNLWLELAKYSDQEVKDSGNAFNLGMIATKVSGPWELQNMNINFPDLNYGIALIPRLEDGGIHASNIGGENMVVFNSTQKGAAAWALIKYLTYSSDTSLLMAKSSGNFPALLEAGQTPQFQQDENMRVFMEQMETAQPRPRIASWLKINDEVVAKALAQALLGEMSAEEALTLADQKANMILQRDR